MPTTYIISKDHLGEIIGKREENRDKQADKRLWAVQLRGEGMKNPQIAEKLDTSPKVVSRWISAYCNKGINALLRGKFGGNRRNMSYEEESEFLSTFEKRAHNGQIVETSDIKQSYEALVGHSIGGSQIYRVLHRHGWRKIMPHSQHPGKASEAEVEASKKLRQNTKR
jgi:transposase